MRHKTSFLTTLLLAAVILASCGAAPLSTAPTSALSGSSAPTAVQLTATQQAPKPTEATLAGGDPAIIKIVSSLPRTGADKPTTDRVVNAIRQRFEEDNYQVCQGRFKIVYEDLDDATAASGNWDAAQEAKNAHQAAADADVMVYIGPQNSGAAKISIPILNRAGLVMISPDNTYPGLTKPGRGEAGEPDIYYPTGKRNYTRVIAADDLQGVVAAVWAKDLGVQKIYILHDTEAYGKGIAEIVSARVKKLGIEVVGEEGIDKRAEDYMALAAKIKNANADLVFFGGNTATHGDMVVRDLRAVGYTSKFMGPDGIYEQTFLDRAGAAAEGTYVTFASVPADKLTGKGKQWYDSYKQQFNIEPVSYTPLGYEAASVALAAINTVCKKDRAAILEAVLATRDFDGVLGRWSFDINGDISLTTMSGFQVKNGNFEFVRVLSEG